MQYFLNGVIDFLPNLIMFIIAGVLIWLAIVKEYEPTLLLPIGFGAILANIPLSNAIDPKVLTILYDAGIKLSFSLY